MVLGNADAKFNTSMVAVISVWVDKIYLLAYSMFICSEFLNVTGYYDFYHIFLWRWVFDLGLPAFFFVVSIFKIIKLMFENRRKALMLLLLFVGSLVYSEFKSVGIMDVFLVVSLMISAYGIEFKKIASVFVISEGWSCIATILSALIGIIPNIAVDEPDGRHYILLGFGSHNVLMIALFFISMSVIVILANRRYRFLSATIIGILTVVGYKITASRTSSAVLMLGVAGLYIISVLNLNIFTKCRKKILRVLGGFLVVAPAMGVLLTIVGTLIWNYFVKDMVFDYSVKDFALWGNTVTNRFADISINFAVHGFNLPWEPIKVTEVLETEKVTFNWIMGGTYVTHNFDNLYASTFIVQGLLVFVLMMGWFVLRSIRAYKTKDITMLFVFALICLFSVFEGVGRMPVYCPFLLMPFSVWERDRELLKTAERFEWDDYCFDNENGVMFGLRSTLEKIKNVYRNNFKLVGIIGFVYILFTIADFVFIGKGYGIYPTFSISWLITGWIISVSVIATLGYMAVSE